jgi:hypothetical protein
MQPFNSPDKENRMSSRQPTRRLRIVLRDVLANIALALVVGIGASVTLASGAMLLAYVAQSAPAVENSSPRGADLRT